MPSGATAFAKNDAVAGLAGRVLARAVLQPLYNRERIVDNGMRRFAVNADDRTDAAGIMLKILTV